MQWNLAFVLLCITSSIPDAFSLMKIFIPKLFKRANLISPRLRLIASYSQLSTWENAAGVTLVIVESPSKAKTFQKILGDGYIVESCNGHVRNLSKSSKSLPISLKRKVVLDKVKITVATLGVDVYDDFKPIYEPLSEKVSIIYQLRKVAARCTRLLLATDEDREGEAISWHLLETLNPVKIPVKRAVFHEITEEAIKASFSNPRDIDMDLVMAQETRRILDRLVGFTVSPILWK